MTTTAFTNPFRPGAGHMPPYLAGREKETAEFAKLLAQDDILENGILTGLRGVGKTVLLDTLKPLAQQQGWLWVGNDLSEASSISENNLALRLLADIAVVTSPLTIGTTSRRAEGVMGQIETIEEKLDFEHLMSVWESTPGLTSDRLKAVLETAWTVIQGLNVHGVIFAYDEAQNLADHADKDQYPMSLLLDVFQSIQRKGMPFMLVLVGLPTLFPKLVEARTFSERMFHLIMLGRLSEAACRDAVLKPIDDANCPVKFSPESVGRVYQITRGYAYFIQYVCREAYDVWSLLSGKGVEMPPIPVADIMRKLDSDFFAGRWARATDRQRDLLMIIAQLKNSATEFTVQEIVEASKLPPARAFGSSHVNQMLASLGEAGLVYKNRWGRYSLAVPLLDEFIRRQIAA